MVWDRSQHSFLFLVDIQLFQADLMVKCPFPLGLLGCLCQKSVWLHVCGIILFLLSVCLLIYRYHIPRFPYLFYNILKTYGIRPPTLFFLHYSRLFYIFIRILKTGEIFNLTIWCLLISEHEISLHFWSLIFFCSVSYCSF